MMPQSIGTYKRVCQNFLLWMIAAFCFVASVDAQEAASKLSSENCTLKALKVSKAEKVNLSKWESAAAAPMGGIWTDFSENSQQGQYWLIVSGILDCNSGFPLEETKIIDDSSVVYPAIAYSGTCADIEKDKFNVIENSPGTGRIANGKMIWAVIPNKKTGRRTIYLSDDQTKSGPSDIGLCLVFAVSKTAKKLNLHIGAHQEIHIPLEK